MASGSTAEVINPLPNFQRQGLKKVIGLSRHREIMVGGLSRLEVMLVREKEA